uniref:Uncharacterized protein n=1 Tax=Sphaerodactylus townsendi TaxID=933632 RepID=A0ACB8FYC2_9SAUR
MKLGAANALKLNPAYFTPQFYRNQGQIFQAPRRLPISPKAFIIKNHLTAKNPPTLFPRRQDYAATLKNVCRLRLLLDHKRNRKVINPLKKTFRFAANIWQRFIQLCF